jgi:hypothetical protein
VHFVANHELHATDPALSVRALQLLQQTAALHPHARALPADRGGCGGGPRGRPFLVPQPAAEICGRARRGEAPWGTRALPPPPLPVSPPLRLCAPSPAPDTPDAPDAPPRPADLPARVAGHAEVWHPLARDATVTGRLGAAGFQLLQRLVAGALEAATGEAPEGGAAAPAPAPGPAPADGAEEEGSAGRVGPRGRALLLHYVVGVAQSDLAARLRVWRAARDAGGDGGARTAEAVLQNALLWRLLQVRGRAGDAHAPSIPRLCSPRATRQ